MGCWGATVFALNDSLAIVLLGSDFVYDVGQVGFLDVVQGT
jgi:hypothetical protein